MPFQKGNKIRNTGRTRFKKGHKPWNKGKPLSKKIREKLSESHKGQVAWNKGIRGIMKINKTSFKKGHTPWNKGKRMKDLILNYIHPNKGKSHPAPKTAFKKNDIRLIGKNNPSWKGGKSFEPYGVEFNEKLKKKIRKRDKFRCQECFRHQNELKRKLHVHHIDFDKKNSNENNLISLCTSCHNQTQFNRENWIGYFKNRVSGKI